MWTDRQKEICTLSGTENERDKQTDRLTKWKTDIKTKTQRCGQRDKRNMYIIRNGERKRQTERQTD
jgi:hypothetical protein